MLKPLSIAVLALVSGLVFGQEKVSGGNTPPAGGQVAQDQASAEKSRREAAKKALEALKGKKADKESDRKGAGR